VRAGVGEEEGCAQVLGKRRGGASVLRGGGEEGRAWWPGGRGGGGGGGGGRRGLRVWRWGAAALYTISVAKWAGGLVGQFWFFG
jgi:hypothetical protein